MVPVASHNTATATHCDVEYYLWSSGANPTRLAGPFANNDKFFGLPCSANIEAELSCDGKIPRHVTIELGSSPGKSDIDARGENNKPYFLYGDNSQGVFDGDIPPSKNWLHLNTNVYEVGDANPSTLRFKFRNCIR